VVPALCPDAGRQSEDQHVHRPGRENRRRRRPGTVDNAGLRLPCLGCGNRLRPPSPQGRGWL